MESFWQLMIEDLGSLTVDPFNSLFRLMLSMLLGAAVGTERKRKGQIAGVRTFALISMGACLAMLLSIYVPQEYLGLKNGDPGRIAAQVITGIGFIGGGAIIQMKGSVRGLTTAAGIWSTAIIGMACGIGMYFVAVGATVMIFIVLVLFEMYERWRGIGQEAKVINVTASCIVAEITPYREVFRDFDTHISTYYIDYNYKENKTEISFLVLVHRRDNIIPLLDKLRLVNTTDRIVLASQLDV